jgi:peptidyl-prolyl cis-trans isomerase B (cyclophilin B)
MLNFRPVKSGDTLVTLNTNYGDIKILMLPEAAPKSVENFVGHCKEGYYDGIIFHRVISGFMIQGGDPTGTGMGGSKKTIKGEFKINGVKNDLSHKRGVISMARTQIPDSASSQFFICYGDCTFLDGQYAAFGKVVEGMETVDDFLKIDRRMSFGGERSTPVEPIVMKTVEVIE